MDPCRCRGRRSGSCSARTTSSGRARRSPRSRTRSSTTRSSRRPTRVWSLGFLRDWRARRARPVRAAVRRGAGRRRGALRARLRARARRAAGRAAARAAADRVRDDRPRARARSTTGPPNPALADDRLDFARFDVDGRPHAGAAPPRDRARAARQPARRDRQLRLRQRAGGRVRGRRRHAGGVPGVGLRRRGRDDGADLRAAPGRAGPLRRPGPRRAARALSRQA